ncbi:MAG: hypothetical protein U9O50_09220 [Acidobacteriota bacterium]|nr:hypothetical protein [Acidobacteriota bacterium]
MTLRGGVIIIGSLLWDTKKNRQKWRENDLYYKNGFQAYLPIRYGRCSTTRRNTYTMVFSNKCYSRRYGLGTGWILPIRAETNSFNDLKVEAKKMGKVEGFNDGLSNNWGSVALLLNPNNEIDNSISAEWAKLMSSKISNHSLLIEKLKSEKSPIESNGFLAIRWQEEVTQKKKIEKLDFLIATVTSPTLIKGRYPTAYRIADAMKKAKYYDYFLRNMRHGIITFQDEKILRRIPKIGLKE